MVLRALQYLGIRAALGGLTLAATMVFSRLVPPEEWGRYALVLAAAMLASSGLFGWMGVAVVREHRHARRRALPALFAATASVAVLAALAAWAWGLPAATVLPALALTLALAAFDLSLNLSQARHDVAAFAAKSLVRGTLALGLGVLAARYGADGLLWAAVAALVGCLLPFLRRDLGHLAPRRPKPGEAAALARFGAPIAAGFALSWVLDMADRFLIAHLLGEAAAGRYAMGYDMARYPLWLAVSAASLATLPSAAREFDRGGAAAARPVLASGLLTLLMVGLPLLAAECLFPAELARLFLGPDYAPTAAILMPLVAVAVLLQGVRAYVLDITIHLSRRTRDLFLMLLWAAAANIGFNLLLIPDHGLWGAALATLLSHLVALAYWAAAIGHWGMLGIDRAGLARLGLALAVFLGAALVDWTPLILLRLMVAGLAYAVALAALDVAGLGRELRRLVAAEESP